MFLKLLSMPNQIEMREQFHCSRSPIDVFDYIADFSRIDEWDHTIISSKKISNGAIGLGSKFDLIFSMGLRKVPIRYEIIEYIPNSRVVLSGVSDTFTAVDTVNIEKTDSGCHVEWQAELEFSGIAKKLIPLMRNRIIKGGVQTIRDLAVALEDNFQAPRLGLLPKIADTLVLPGLVGFTKFGYQHAQKEWRPVSSNMKGKHVVITGATSGLGLATAQRLAHLGAELTLVARDQSKAKAVVAKIVKQTGNQSIEIEIAELSEISQVRRLAARLLKKGKKIDVLVNNAGALLNPRQETNEGVEKSFALLLLSPFVLTEALHPLLLKSGSARIINVSSGGMYATRLSLKNIENTLGEYRGADAYARAKRGLVITGEQWAEQWSDDGVTVHNMHPGWAFTPGVEVGLPGFTKRMRRVLRTPQQGADTIIWLSSATEVAKTSGLFWLDRRPHSTHLSSKTRETKEQRLGLRLALEEYAGRFSSKR